MKALVYHPTFSTHHGFWLVIVEIATFVATSIKVG